MDFDIHQAANMLVSLKTRAIEHHNTNNLNTNNLNQNNSHHHHAPHHLHLTHSNINQANNLTTASSHPQLAHISHLDDLTQSGPYDLRRNQVIDWRTLLPLFTIDSPAHLQPVNTKQHSHIKRPSNSFILFSRKYRPLVHQRYPNSDNRTVSKILGQWWYNLDQREKDKYKSEAFQQKEDHFKKHPEWKWCTKSQSSPSATPSKSGVGAGGASGGNGGTNGTNGNSANNHGARRDSSSAIFSPPVPLSAPPLSAPPLTAPSTLFASSSGASPAATTASSCSQENHRVQQQRFFGPNFPNDLSVAAATAGSSSRDQLDLSMSSSSKQNTPLSASFQTPTSPCLTADDTKEPTSHRRTLSKQRRLVMELFTNEGFFPSAAATTKFLAEHDNVFTSKKQLQHKIREVRQNFMSQSRASKC